jgi:hypothetical protein|tara:strand:+ start:194 stop:832 length:639 start_codon:yes stop_codon:yes gene_type:complete
MWWDIIKNQQQTSSRVINLDWEEESIPEAQEDDCLRWVREFNVLIKKFKEITGDVEFNEITHMEPSQEHNQIVCQVFDEIKEMGREGKSLFSEQDWFKLGEGYTGVNQYNSTEGIVYTIQHYDGDGYQALLYIKKDDKTIVNSMIEIYIPEPFDDYFRTTLRSYDGKGKEPNPDYKGDEKAKELNDILLEINSHFQKLSPIFDYYRYDRLKE